MTADTDKRTDGDLEVFFQAAREVAAEPSPDLMARVLADAYAEQDAAAIATGADTAGAPAETPRPPRRRIAGLLEAIGGWPAVAGLAAATLAGVWIGYNPPAALDNLSLDLLDSGYALTMDSSLPGIDYLLADG